MNKSNYHDYLHTTTGSKLLLICCSNGSTLSLYSTRRKLTAGSCWSIVIWNRSHRWTSTGGSSTQHLTRYDLHAKAGRESWSTSSTTLVTCRNWQKMRTGRKVKQWEDSFEKEQTTWSRRTRNGSRQSTNTGVISDIILRTTPDSKKLSMICLTTCRPSLRYPPATTQKHKWVVT